MNSVEYDDLPRVWVVLGEGMQPEYVAGWAAAAHEHINDAIERGIPEAARWIVREYTPIKLSYQRP